MTAPNTDMQTTSAPPMPAQRVSSIGLKSSPRKPIMTVSPDQAIVLPACATVIATVVAMSVPDSAFSR